MFETVDAVTTVEEQPVFAFKMKVLGDASEAPLKVTPFTVRDVIAMVKTPAQFA
jgi:hypothetical protein